MPQLERRLVDSLLKYKNGLYFAAITLLAVCSRVIFLHSVSADMQIFLLPWFDEIQAAGGFPALARQVGDYNIAYQFIICLFSYLPTHIKALQPLYLYKYLSIVFDFLLALAAGRIVARLKGGCKALWFNLTYTIVIMVPTVVFNSAVWGQCDSIFTFFLIVSLYCLLEEKDVAAFLLYGVALVFKLQAIFLLPFYCIAYFHYRRFSIGLFALPILVLWLSGIPAFFFGRSLLAPFEIYLNQSGEYQWMYNNVVSFWILTGGDYETLSRFAILLTFTILGMGLYAVLSGLVKLDKTEQFLAGACWCLWTCVLFLPAMHERYTYPRDILLMMLAMVNLRYVKFALPEICFSLITYCHYLLATPEVGVPFALVSLGLWLWFSVGLVTDSDSPRAAAFRNAVSDLGQRLFQKFAKRMVKQ